MVIIMIEDLLYNTSNHPPFIIFNYNNSKALELLLLLCSRVVANKEVQLVVAVVVVAILKSEY
jgi:hypothetical protein